MSGAYPRVGPYCMTALSRVSSSSRVSVCSSGHGNMSAAGAPAANEIRPGILAASVPVLRMADSWN